MQIAYLTTLASLAMAATYQDVINDAATIKKDIIALNNTLNSFKAGDVGGGLALLVSSGQLQDALKKASSDVQASAPFGDNSQAVAVALSGLSDPTFSLLDNFVSRKTDLQKPIFGFIKPSSITKSNLITDKAAVDQFGANVTAKVNDQFKPLVPQAIAVFDQHFDAAIAAFS